MEQMIQESKKEQELIEKPMETYAVERIMARQGLIKDFKPKVEKK